MSGAIARTQADDILEQGQNETRELFSFLYSHGKTAEAQRAYDDPGFFKQLLAWLRSGELASQLK